ncbi:hypothetical protein PGT21_013344 [Puccinia graminis f. sp. tritici]|uniref:Uncharacterized protein n=1 Tax=Puccinia graminis f. sp. tritici TaxID=56615 RepID=A0A5B0QWG0_PUCGR|nr:hypothetical protein PGT21_013344 [Puccinia graminis f. sp. tritici]
MMHTVRYRHTWNHVYRCLTGGNSLQSHQSLHGWEATGKTTNRPDNGGHTDQRRPTTTTAATPINGGHTDQAVNHRQNNGGHTDQHREPPTERNLQRKHHNDQTAATPINTMNEPLKGVFEKQFSKWMTFDWPRYAWPPPGVHSNSGPGTRTWGQHGPANAAPNYSSGTSNLPGSSLLNLWNGWTGLDLDAPLPGAERFVVPKLRIILALYSVGYPAQASRGHLVKLFNALAKERDPSGSVGDICTRSSQSDPKKKKKNSKPTPLNLLPQSKPSRDKIAPTHADSPSHVGKTRRTKAREDKFFQPYRSSERPS